MGIQTDVNSASSIRSCQENEHSSADRHFDSQIEKIVSVGRSPLDIMPSVGYPLGTKVFAREIYRHHRGEFITTAGA